jgi:hypothetical protein
VRVVGHTGELHEAIEQAVTCMEQNVRETVQIRVIHVERSVGYAHAAGDLFGRCCVTGDGDQQLKMIEHSGERTRRRLVVDL